MAVSYGPAQHHQHAWDWDYEGMVWMRITPSSRRPKMLYPSLFWGSWMRPTVCPATPEGVVLFTNKGRDARGEAATLRLLSNHEVFVSFGVEDDVPAAGCYYDINGLWMKPSAGDEAARKSGTFWVEPDAVPEWYRKVEDPAGGRLRLKQWARERGALQA
jgi:hypothetical protein